MGSSDRLAALIAGKMFFPLSTRSACAATIARYEVRDPVSAPHG
jgi:hypothetical protein